MTIIRRIDKMIVDMIATGDVATNNAKGKIDVVGGDCPDGMHYCKKRKTCVPDIKEGYENRFGAVRFSKRKEHKSKEIHLSDNEKVKEITVSTENPNPAAVSGVRNSISRKKYKTREEAEKAYYKMIEKAKKQGWEITKKPMWMKESIVAAAVVGSGQTRAWGDHFSWMDALETKEKVIDKNDDKAKENLGRPDLKFDSLLGAYVPKTDTDTDDTQMENGDE